MVSLAELWMPIVVSAVFIFLASSIIWMVLPIHKGDYKRLPDEAGLMEEVRRREVPAGMYAYPFCEHKDRKNPDVMERYKAGPWGCLIAQDGPPNMGISLAMWMVNLLLMATAVAYLASVTFAPGTDYKRVFIFVAVAAFLAHGGSLLTDSIWKGRPWRTMWSNLHDAVVYALLTAGTFGWLWPQAV